MGDLKQHPPSESYGKVTELITNWLRATLTRRHVHHEEQKTDGDDAHNPLRPFPRPALAHVQNSRPDTLPATGGLYHQPPLDLT